jgi:hypothetical protein
MMVSNVHGGNWFGDGQLGCIPSVGKSNLLVLFILAIMATAHA